MDYYDHHDYISYLELIEYKNTLLNEVYSYICTPTITPTSISTPTPTLFEYVYDNSVGILIIPSILFGISGIAYGLIKRNEMLKNEQENIKKIQSQKLSRIILPSITIPTDLLSLTDSENYSDMASSTDYPMEDMPLN